MAPTTDASVLADGAGVAPAPGGRLPRTGGSPGRVVALGGLLLVLGIGLSWLGTGRGRRRGSARAPGS